MLQSAVGCAAGPAVDVADQGLPLRLPQARRICRTRANDRAQARHRSRRFGQPGGSFLAPADASYMGRSIPYDRLKMPYYRYEVRKPLRVAAGRTAAWFDQPGGGIQYKTGRRVSELLASGHLKQLW